MRLGELLRILDDFYHPSWAEPWDRVGLVCGDPEQRVGRVLLAVDPARPVVEEAREYGADMLLVHHPLFLTPVSSVAATTPKGRVVHDLVRSGIALLTAHTNADVPSQGVNESLASALGLRETRVLAPSGGHRLDKLVTFAPHDAADAVRAAVTSAGAGRIGAYDSCTFSSPGEGRFRPLEGADPAVGAVGRLEVVEEVRIESVYPRELRARVVAALREAHPYEEPAYDLLELGNTGEPSRGHGRIGRLHEPMALRAFADHVVAALPRTAQGARVAGDPERPVRTVAVGAGAGDSLLETVLASDADVYVTSDLRHHRAAEFLEHGGPALVDVAHWAAEWTWLPVAERTLREAVAAAGDTVDTRVSTVVTDPWSFRAG